MRAQAEDENIADSPRDTYRNAAVTTQVYATHNSTQQGMFFGTKAVKNETVLRKVSESSIESDV